ncbi:40S ribosomal protein S12 [Polytolypa hystricis UAMH7299]|uniref:40S ribosomal protein S12 n=1 Tax=Polytolypa hystricis (strain UAMH7299) TaxID=1447883 RepID=A0A2B7XJE9_POLH7|nr:40S ribosomal protein S12 [Polytolypa hystricis UAMH7299]
MNDAEAVLSSSPAASVDRIQPGTTDSQKASLNILPPPRVPSPLAQKEETQRKRNGVSDNDDAASARADSEAETIIQSGREELSPEKKRTYIQHKRGVSVERGGNKGVGTFVSDDVKPRKRQRIEEKLKGRDATDGHPSSGRSSRVSSPERTTRRDTTDDPRATVGKRDLSHARSEGLDSTVRSSKKRWSSEGIGAGDEGVSRHPRDKQHNEAPRNNNNHRVSEEPNNTSHTRRISKDRSISPHIRFHKRTTSVSSHARDDVRKKKKRTPLITTDFRRHSSEDRESVSSSASGSPLHSAPLRKAATSEFTPNSPLKPMFSKKRRDQNGRTRLARACAAQEIDVAKARHRERPEDLNVPDNAGNTPLQIASLEGCKEIVKFLINAGCEIDTKNIDKDTPLIDAVENGHLEVVKLLLDAGANPRIGNAEGDEPYELVPSDNDGYEEIRRIIAEAKSRSPRRRKSDDHGGRGTSSAREITSRGASAASPRESPPVIGPRSPPPATTAPRRRTVRSDPTRNDLLWTSATPENLREFAAKGDMAGVVSILNVVQKADTESMIAAAKGGHDEVLGILLGMGDPEPDPLPLQTGNHKPGYNTPMLAAIGRGNLEVIRLLLNQPLFDPTRRFHHGRTYYEISRERRGDSWGQEYDLLKEAYDNYAKSHRSRKPDSNSPRRPREQEKDSKRAIRRDSSSPATVHRKVVRSSDSHRQQDDTGSELGKDKKKRSAIAVVKEKASSIANKGKSLHRESSKVESEHSVAHMERKKLKSHALGKDKDSASSGRGEEPVKRRRLIAGRPPPDHVRRRESLLSSDSLSGRDEPPRTQAERTKREAKLGKENISLKRSRSSQSPPPSRSHDKQHKDGEGQEIQKKRRRLQSEDGTVPHSQEVSKKANDVSVSSKTPLDRRDSSSAKTDHDKPQTSDDHNETSMDSLPKPDHSASVVKEEQKKQDLEDINDIPVEDAHVSESESKEAREAEEKRMAIQAQREKEEREANEAREAEAKRVVELEQAAAREKAAEEERIRKEEEQRRIREEEEKKKQAAAEAEREKAEREAREAKEAEEAREAAAREKAAEEERKRKEAEQRRIRQAEEERQKRLEQERLRLARMRKEQEEQEQRRREALPNRLRAAAHLIGSNNPVAKTHRWLEKFMPVVTATTRQFDPTCNDEAAEDRWIPNYLVAPLLGSNDLQLSQYPSWEKRSATRTQRENLWRVTRRSLIQEGEMNPLTTTFEDINGWVRDTKPKFFAMEHVFWVRLSDFMELVPHIPHLHGLDIRLLKMHIDAEPSEETVGLQQPNGIPPESPSADSAARAGTLLQLSQPTTSPHFNKRDSHIHILLFEDNPTLEQARIANSQFKMSDGEETMSNPPVAADEVEVEVSADAADAGSMSVLDALKGVLKIALIHDGLARGLREAAKALDRRQAHMCVLNEGCEEEAYKKLVVALCSEHKIPLIKVPDGKMLGEWVGLCQLDREGNPRKVVNCSCVVLKDWGEESQERSILLNYFQTEQ